MAIEDIKKKYEEELRKKANVNGVVTGRKTVGGVRTTRKCVVVMVEKKVPLSTLKPKDRVPKTLEGVETDVIEVGKLDALDITGHSLIAISNDIDRTKKYRPAPGGISCGHPDVTAGTLGELLHDRDTGWVCIGTNNHVAANSNGALIGDDLLQPGPYDGGTDEDVIGHLLRFVPISFTGVPSDCPVAGAIVKLSNFIAKLFNRRTRLKAIVEANPVYNRVDGAIIRTSQDKVISTILSIGVPKGVGKAELDMPVQKSGRTTGHTTNGIVIGTDATVGPISYGEGKTAYFENQIVIQGEGFCAGGDSGSMVFDMKLNAVGKLFAGSPNTTIANHIDDYLNELDAELVIANE